MGMGLRRKGKERKGKERKGKGTIVVPEEEEDESGEKEGSEGKWGGNSVSRRRCTRSSSQTGGAHRGRRRTQRLGLQAMQEVSPSFSNHCVAPLPYTALYLLLSFFCPFWIITKLGFLPFLLNTTTI